MAAGHRRRRRRGRFRYFYRVFFFIPSLTEFTEFAELLIGRKVFYWVLPSFFFCISDLKLGVALSLGRVRRIRYRMRKEKSPLRFGLGASCTTRRRCQPMAAAFGGSVAFRPPVRVQLVSVAAYVRPCSPNSQKRSKKKKKKNKKQKTNASLRPGLPAHGLRRGTRPTPSAHVSWSLFCFFCSFRRTEFLPSFRLCGWFLVVCRILKDMGLDLHILPRWALTQFRSPICIFRDAFCIVCLFFFRLDSFGV